MAAMVQYMVVSDGILDGTIADHPPFVTRAWLAILFDAEKLRGRVHAPVRKLANRAKISNDEAATSLAVLQAPDPLSSSQAHEGRRLLPIVGEENWYTVVTWEKHAEEREVFFHRLRQQRYSKKKTPPQSLERKSE